MLRKSLAIHIFIPPQQAHGINLKCALVQVIGLYIYVYMYMYIYIV